jgi:hypothetical protein
MAAIAEQRHIATHEQKTTSDIQDETGAGG